MTTWFKIVPDYVIMLIVMSKKNRRAFRTAALAIVCASIIGLIASMFVKMHPVGGIVLCLTAMAGILACPSSGASDENGHRDEDGKTKA